MRLTDLFKMLRSLFEMYVLGCRLVLTTFEQFFKDAAVLPIHC